MPIAVHPPRLSQRDALRVVECVAELTADGLPLGEGLRAAAAECRSRRLTRTFQWMAEEVEQGRDVDEVLAEMDASFPREMQALVRAAGETGDVSGMLIRFAEHRRRIETTKQSIYAALAYPCLLLALLVTVFAFLSATTVQPMRSLVDEFEIELPQTTAALFWIADVGIWLLIAVIVLTIAIAVVVRVVAGATRYNALLAAIPLVGPAWRSLAVVEMAYNLRALLDRDLPLPRALRCAAESSSDAMIGDVLGDLASAVEQGTLLSLALREDGRLPASLTPHIDAGETQGTLPEAFEAIAELFGERVESRADWLRHVLPPVVFIFIAIAVFSLMSARLPLIELINQLS
jgi:general secretion pathway protein F